MARQGGWPLHTGFTWIDWLVLVAYLATTTWIGAALAGRQSTIRAFFLGGHKLPWWAVAGSFISTEISAVTLIAVPAGVFRPGGDLTYLLFAIGAILARVIVALVFVPAYYQREIYSPYDYVGEWLGPSARRVTTVLFLIGAVLGQSVRVLLTAIVLDEISGLSLGSAIWVIAVTGIAWTLVGGMTSVIWTDIIQFVVFIGAMLAAGLYLFAHVPGGIEEIVQVASQAPGPSGEIHSKLHFWNLSLDPRVQFTLWTGLIANTLMCLNAYGGDQMMAQRIFCCRSRREATWAVLASNLGLGVAVLGLCVGLALYAFYQHKPLPPDVAARVGHEPDRVFLHFIVSELPTGIKGLIIAGILAASAITSVLAALAQTTMALAGVGFSENQNAASAAAPASPQEQGRYVLISRLLVAGWGVALAVMAHGAQLAYAHYRDLLNLALAAASITGGSILAALLIALLRIRVDGFGLIFAAPLSLLCVLAVMVPHDWMPRVVALAALAVLVAWLVAVFQSVSYWATEWWRDTPKTLHLVAAGCLAVWLATGPWPDQTGAWKWCRLQLAWPWNVPLGFAVAFWLGVALGRPRKYEHPIPPRPSWE